MMAATSINRSSSLIPSTRTSHKPRIGRRLKLDDVRYDKFEDLLAKLGVGSLNDRAQLLTGAYLFCRHLDLEIFEILEGD